MFGTIENNQQTKNKLLRNTLVQSTFNIRSTIVTKYVTSHLQFGSTQPSLLRGMVKMSAF